MEVQGQTLREPFEYLLTNLTTASHIIFSCVKAVSVNGGGSSGLANCISIYSQQ